MIRNKESADDWSPSLANAVTFKEVLLDSANQQWFGYFFISKRFHVFSLGLLKIAGHRMVALRYSSFPDAYMEANTYHHHSAPSIYCFHLKFFIRNQYSRQNRCCKIIISRLSQPLRFTAFIKHYRNRYHYTIRLKASRLLGITYMRNYREL